MLGLSQGKNYEIDVYTTKAPDAEIYIWVRAIGTQFLMPYINIYEMLGDWVFGAEDDADLDISNKHQEYIKAKWLDTYCVFADGKGGETA